MIQVHSKLSVKIKKKIKKKKNPILIGNIETQFTFTLLKAQVSYLAIFSKIPKVFNTWKIPYVKLNDEII